MIGLVTHDIVGRQMMAKAVGTLYGIVAIPMTVGPPMAGRYQVFFLTSLTVIFFHVTSHSTLYYFVLLNVRDRWL